jgi:hypothetical protein
MNTYNITDQKLHLLAQTIAKVNRTFVEPKEDNSHTNLFFDPAGKRLFGRWIDTPDGKIILSINIVNQSFEWCNEKLIRLTGFTFKNKTITEIEEEASESLAILGINADHFNEKMDYEMPDYPFATEKIEPFEQKALNEWSYIRRQANEAAMMCLGMLQQRAEIRICPHQFNTGLYIEPNEHIGIGFGFAMQDEMVESPYMYITGNPLKNEIDYINLPDIGIATWEVNSQWKGAILPYTELNKLADKYRKDQVEIFINNTTLWYLNH